MLSILEFDVHYEALWIVGKSRTAGLERGVEKRALLQENWSYRPLQRALLLGDNPDNPRDPDRTEATNPAQKEFRNRFIPSALDQEVLLSAFVRVRSFRPEVTDVGMRLFLAYAQEIGRVDQNADGVISFQEADINGFSDGGQSNRRLYLSPRDFNRFAVTREINDGFLAPRWAPLLCAPAWLRMGESLY